MKSASNIITGAMLITLSCFVISTGCKDNNDIVPDTDAQKRLELISGNKTETDKWIEENYIKKYNIDPIWRWKMNEVDWKYNLVPPKETNIIPFLRILDRVFIDVYVQVVSKDFMNTYVPKQFLLVGTDAYNISDGTITLGTAEGGRKITLYGINDWRNVRVMSRYIHTMYHEFSHILHQTKLYPEEFEKITAEYYTAQWANGTDQEALEQGFITKYSRLNKDEDFVEILSTYLTLSDEEWKQRVDGIDGTLAGQKAADHAKQEGKSKEEQAAIAKAVATETASKAKAAINKKLNIVTDYLKTQWGIEIDTLKKVCQERIIETIESLKDDNLTTTALPYSGTIPCSKCGHKH